MFQGQDVFVYKKKDSEVSRFQGVYKSRFQCLDVPKFLKIRFSRFQGFQVLRF
jgi:hypothetical protein